MDEALEQYRIALSLDPLSSIIGANYALLLMEAAVIPSPRQFQKFSRAIRIFHRPLQLSQLYAPRRFLSRERMRKAFRISLP